MMVLSKIINFLRGTSAEVELPFTFIGNRTGLQAKISLNGKPMRPLVHLASGGFTGFSWGDVTIESWHTAFCILHHCFGGVIASERTSDFLMHVIYWLRSDEWVLTGKAVERYLMEGENPFPPRATRYQTKKNA